MYTQYKHISQYLAAKTCAIALSTDISKWDVSSVRDMGEMFGHASVFDADISKWDVSVVTDKRGMFNNADAFNADISNWIVSAVTNMRYIFFHVNAFDADMSKWDVSSVTGMTSMFHYASSFNQVLCGAAWVSSNAAMGKFIKTPPVKSIHRVRSQFPP